MVQRDLGAKAAASWRPSDRDLVIVMGPFTRGDRCATAGWLDLAKTMSLAMDGIGDMDGIGGSRRSANGKHCSE